MYLLNNLRVRTLRTKQKEKQYEFNIQSNLINEYLTENFELFSQQNKSFIYSHYKETAKIVNQVHHAIYKSDKIDPIYLVAYLQRDKGLWTEINNKRLRLNNILTKSNF